MLRKSYNALTTLGSLAAGPLFLLSSRGRQRIQERYGVWGNPIGDCMWFHGASMGEVNGLLPLMREYKRLNPKVPVLLSATSPTGLSQGLKEADQTRLAPFDSSWWVGRALRNVRPRAFVFGETELWPMLLSGLLERDIPCYLVNGRVSDAALNKYQAMRGILAPMLRHLRHVSVQSERHRNRFIQIGVPAERVSVDGCSKFDSSPIEGIDAYALRQEFGLGQHPVVVLGSLRPGEELIWFAAVQQALAATKNVRVIIAPRHAEKFEFFAVQLRSWGIPFTRRSENSAMTTRVLLLDTLGELSKLTAVADLAFVGGTLAQYGGHNPLEPAMYGVCPVLGPDFRNAVDVVEMLQAARACLPMGSVEDAVALLSRVEQQDSEIKAVGLRAQAVWRQCSGATQRIISRIPEFRSHGG